MLLYVAVYKSLVNCVALDLRDGTLGRAKRRSFVSREVFQGNLLLSRILTGSFDHEHFLLFSFLLATIAFVSDTTLNELLR